MRSALRGTPSVIACGDATLPFLSPTVTKRGNLANAVSLRGSF